MAVCADGDGVVATGADMAGADVVTTGDGGGVDVVDGRGASGGGRRIAVIADHRCSGRWPSTS
jgi:hypothetical protein